MKTISKAILMAAMLFCALGWNATLAAQTPTTVPESPIGRLVDVQLVAWPLGTAVVSAVKGTLIAMPSGWLVIKEGSYEHWIPVEKVMSMKVSR